MSVSNLQQRDIPVANLGHQLTVRHSGGIVWPNFFWGRPTNGESNSKRFNEAGRTI